MAEGCTTTFATDSTDSLPPYVNLGGPSTLTLDAIPGVAGTEPANAILQGAGNPISLDITGGSTIVLLGSNDYSGGTTIQSVATLEIHSAQALGTGSVTFSGTSTLTTLIGAPLANNFIVNPGVTANFEGPSSVLSGVIQDGAGGPGNVFFADATTLPVVMTLAARNTYTGMTTIEGAGFGAEATLALRGTGSIEDSSAVLIGPAGTLDISETIGGASIKTLGDRPGFGGPRTVSLGAQALTITNGSTTFSGAIQDGGIGGGTGGSLVIAGGTQTLTGTNTYTGNTTITAGTLQIGGAGSLGAGSYAGAIVNNGTFEYSSSAAQTLSGIISGAGALTMDGASILRLSGINNYSGATTVNAGTLMAGGPSAFSPNSPTAVNSGGTLDLGGFNQTVSSLSGAGTVTNGDSLPATLTNQGASSTFSGVIRDGSSMTSLVQNSPGNTLTLTGANTYTGGTTIAAGALQIGGAGSLGGGSYDGAIVNNGIFEYSSSVDEDLTGVVSGAGSLIKDTSPSMLRLSGNAAGFTGETTVSAGILSIAGPFFGSASAPAGPINIGPGGIFSTSGDSSIFSVSITNAGFIDNDGTIIAGALSNLAGASLTNNGTLTDDLSNSGTVTNNGTYIANVASNIGTITNGLAGQWTGNVNIGANVAGGLITNQGSWTGTGYNAGGTIDNQGKWIGAIVNTSGTFTNEGTVSAGLLSSGAATNSGTIRGGVVNSGILGNSGTLADAITNSGILGNAGTINATNSGFMNTGTVVAAREINGGIQNLGRFSIAGSLASDGAFNNNGTVETFAQTLTQVPSTTISALETQLPALTPLILAPPTSTTLTTPMFNNNGVLDLRNPNTVATNFTIGGNYFGGADSRIALNVFGQQANHLSITGSANGTSLVSVSPLTGAFAPLSNPIPIITAGSGTATFTVAPGPPSLVNYTIRQIDPDPVYVLTGNPNLAVIGSIASGPRSAIESVTSGFFEGLYTVFQGSGPFLGAPALQCPAADGLPTRKGVGACTPTANQIDAGVWARAASGMNTEHSVVADNMGSDPVGLRSQTHFGGFQVGSDLGIFNVQNNGWNVHGGVTGGEYQASVGDSSLGAASSSYFVPFLGLYAAVLGHGFFGDVMVRHDFWQGNVSSPAAGLTGAQLNGSANAVTAEAGYTFHFQNGLFATPSLGFSYTSASFDNLTLVPGTPFAPTLNVGPVKSELGRVGLTVGDTFATPYWTLTPNLNGSIWHEFAGETSSALNSAAPGEFFTDTVTESRLGTFGQIGLGLLAQPVLNPNWTLFARADYRTGSNIYGATITAGFRLQF